MLREPQSHVAYVATMIANITYCKETLHGIITNAAPKGEIATLTTYIAVELRMITAPRTLKYNGYTRLTVFQTGNFTGTAHLLFGSGTWCPNLRVDSLDRDADQVLIELGAQR
jgi:hypothetical protein